MSSRKAANTIYFIIFSLTQQEIEPEFTVLVADALFTQALVDWKPLLNLNQQTDNQNR